MTMRALAFSVTALALTGCAHAHQHEGDGSAVASGESHAGHSDHSADHPDKLVRAETGAAVENPFHPIRLLLSSGESAGEVTIYEFILPPKSPGSPPHTHTLEDEYFYVLKGTLDVLSDGEVLRLNPGDFAALNRGHAHMFWNGSNGQTELIMMTTGSSFEAFMEGASPAIAEAKPGSPEEFGAVIGKLAAEHGIAISMEKMPAEAAPFYAPPE